MENVFSSFKKLHFKRNLFFDMFVSMLCVSERIVISGSGSITWARVVLINIYSCYHVTLNGKGEVIFFGPEIYSL